MRDPLIGQQLANFRIERALGRGGMAMVYYGTDVKLERPVAVKVIDTRLQGNPAYARRFVDEAKIVASWRHDNIVQVYYADNEGDLYFFAMEYIDGASLEDLMAGYVADGELMPHDDVLRIGQAMASALDYAHRKRVVHRDVKPSNVMISRDDRVILTDFGLALDTAQGSMGEVFGTPHYIAPEQARRSADAVPQSDLYALGVVLFEMLTGFVPFDDDTAMSVAIQHMSEPPPNPRDLNPNLNQATEVVLLKALSKQPDNRYQTGKALMDALQDAIKGRTASETFMVDSALPTPPPAAMKGRTSAPTERRLSRLSISDMLNKELSKPQAEPPTKEAAFNPVHQQPTKQAPPPKTVTKAQPKSTQETVMRRTQAQNAAAIPQAVSQPPASRNTGLLIGLGVALLVVVIGAGLLFAVNQGNTTTVLPTSAADALTRTAQALASSVESTLDEGMLDYMTETLNAAVTATQNALNQTATAAARPSATDIPTDTPVPPTDVPTNTTVPPSSTPLPTFTSIPPSATAVPQTNTPEPVAVAASPVAFPNGLLVQISWNSAGFYLRNASDTNIRVNRLSFQALDNSGSRTFNDFDGGEWARFYGTLEKGGRCMLIELLNQPGWTRPSNCSVYNSQLGGYDPNDSRVFWTGMNGSTQFAVLWDGAEIARCADSDGYCEVRVGN